MDKELKEKLKEISPELLDEKDLPLYLKLEEIAEHLAKIAEKEMPEMPKMEMPEVQKTEILGAEVITIKGEKGDGGDTGEKGEQGERGLDGKNGKDGKDGKNGTDGLSGLDGKDGVDGKDGKDGSPDTANQIKEKLESLEDKDRLDKSAIKGLDDELKRIEALPRGGGGVSAIGVRQAFKYIFHTEEPTGLINGVNTTYKVSTPIWAIIGFTLNGEQIAELPNYTFANRTITFSSALPAAYSGKDFEIKFIG